jgi:hypothetical protein
VFKANRSANPSNCKNKSKKANKTKNMKINSFVCGAAVVAALFASAHLASAYQVDVNVALDCSFSSVADCSGVTVSGGTGDCHDGYMDETGGGTIAIQVDLPAGTFYVGGTAGPGDMYGAGPDVDVVDGSNNSVDQSNGITGPTTVYVVFLNRGAAITRAAAVSISGDATPQPTTFCVPLDCSFNSVADCSGITISGGTGDCHDGYMDETGGGTITIQVDLPDGSTYSVGGTAGPGDMYGPAADVDVNNGIATILDPGNIVGPATVYVSFLNRGSAITRAAEVCVSRQ